MKLDSEVAAIVTGGASGLGEASARALARTGVRVTIFDLDESRAQRVAQQIGALAVRADVTDEGSVAAAFAQARAAHGQERILVNCAGIIAAARTASRQRDTGAIRRFPTELFERVLQVNLIGTFRCLTQAAAGMLSLSPTATGERGVIVNTASIAAHEGQIGQAAYAASKGGVVALTLPVARDLAAEAIRVNAILPGVFDTAMLQAAGEAVRESLASVVPFPHRAGHPDEFGALVLELCRNTYLNGAGIRLDAALRMPPR